MGIVDCRSSKVYWSGIELNDDSHHYSFWSFIIITCLSISVVVGLERVELVTAVTILCIAAEIGKFAIF